MDGWLLREKIKFTCFDGAMIPQNGNLIYECEKFSLILIFYSFLVYLIHKQRKVEERPYETL